MPLLFAYGMKRFSHDKAHIMGLNWFSVNRLILELILLEGIFKQTNMNFNSKLLFLSSRAVLDTGSI